jgi:NADPH:quinone reductase-like Zn-dependent oxidoreductase
MLECAVTAPWNITHSNWFTATKRALGSLMASQLADKTIVISGASSGIGLATAEAFARAGATVVLIASST